MTLAPAFKKIVCKSTELWKLYIVKSFVNYIPKFDNTGPGAQSGFNLNEIYHRAALLDPLSCNGPESFACLKSVNPLSLED